MLIVVLVFAVVFLFRDVQVLATADRRAMADRFAVYTVIILAAVAVMSEFGHPRPAIQYIWTEKRFALAAVLIQVAELGLALLLRRWRDGRLAWLGAILPCPAFLVSLFALSFTLQNAMSGIGAIGAMEFVTVFWLALVGSLAFLLSGAGDRKFAGDFALMTSCTALIFVPWGFF